MSKYDLKENMYNWSTVIFPGYYDSILYNSDTMYSFNEDMEDLPEGKTYDIEKWEDFTTDVNKQVTKKLDELCACYDVLTGINYLGMSSPKYYNYETDSLNLEVSYNIRKLFKFCFKTAVEDFKKYLHNNFTSYDGFMSFIPNNLEESKRDLHNKKEFEKLLDVMIEFYMLICLNDENRYSCPDNFNTSLADYTCNSYKEDLSEISMNAVYEHAELVDADA